MPLVHQFPPESTLFADTKIPIQYRGGGRPAAARQIDLLSLAQWIQSNTAPSFNVTATVSTPTHAQAIPSEKWCLALAVASSFAQTIDIGTTAGGDNIASGMQVSAGGTESVAILVYGGTGGVSLHFSGLVGTSTITFLFL